MRYFGYKEKTCGTGSICSQIIYFNLFFVMIKNMPGTVLFLLRLCHCCFVLFCLFIFSSSQISVIFDFLDSSGLYCVFDFNSSTKIDRVFRSSDTKRTISTEEWQSCICKVFRTNDAFNFFFLRFGTKVDKNLQSPLFSISLKAPVEYSCRAICSVESALFHVGSKHYIKSEVTFMSIVLWEENFPISPKQY